MCGADSAISGSVNQVLNMLKPWILLPFSLFHFSLCALRQLPVR